jgi:glucose-1-phosphate thymidylyltransferase
MKGIVLAGGLGTRFHPVTKVVNKHLLDVFDEPMVFFPIRALKRAGITDIMVVTGDQVPQFKDLLGEGSELGVQLSYAFQEGEKGIADALGKAEHFARGDDVVIILGDNIFQEDLTPYVRAFADQEKGARILLKEVGIEDAMRFGVGGRG